MRPMRRPHSITLVSFVLCASCGSDASERWTGTVETLPNGAVRITNPARGVWENGTPWRLVPDIVLGRLEDDGAEVFAAISGLEVDAEGRIYVLDRQADELRIFGPDGNHIRTVGRSGEGPGEYRAANGLLWLAEDTLLVIDQQGARYSVLTRDGEYVRSVQRRLPFYSWVFRGGLANGRVYESYAIGPPDGERHPALFGTLLRSEAGPARGGGPAEARSVPLIGAADTVLLPEPDAPPRENFTVQTATAGMVMGVPFTGASVYTIAGSDRIWHGHGSTPTLYLTSFAGDTLSVIVLDVTPAPVTGAELAEWEENPGVKQFRDMGGKLDMDRIPRSKPYFDDITVDPDGYVWLCLPTAPSRSTFAVIDPDGRYLGRLDVDGPGRTTWIRPIVRNDRVYWAGTDELDVPHVYVYRIEKTATTP